MKLFYTPGACSLSPHIVLLEAGLPFTMEKVDLKTKKTEKGSDFTTINSKGAVPALQLDDGRVLTEGSAVVQYLADQKPDLGLAPRAGSFERYQLVELLNYIASELHKGFSPLFNPSISADWKTAVLANLDKKFQWLTTYLGTKNYLMGDTFTGCVSVHRAQLVLARRDRSRQVSRAHGLPCAGGSPAQGARSAQSRGTHPLSRHGARRRWRLKSAPCSFRARPATGPRAVSLSPRRRHRCPAARTAATQAAHTTDSGP